MNKGNPPVCPYCKFTSSMVTGKEIYPHRPDLYELKFYLCKSCDAYVGVHKGTMKPLGRLANAELRRAKIRAHGAFDPLWQDGLTFSSRKHAYDWLASKLGLSRKQCHIGMFDLEMCKRTIEVCSE